MNTGYICILIIVIQRFIGMPGRRNWMIYFGNTSWVMEFTEKIIIISMNLWILLTA